MDPSPGVSLLASFSSSFKGSKFLLPKAPSPCSFKPVNKSQPGWSVKWVFCSLFRVCFSKSLPPRLWVTPFGKCGSGLSLQFVVFWGISPYNPGPSSHPSWFFVRIAPIRTGIGARAAVLSDSSYCCAPGAKWLHPEFYLRSQGKV